MSRTDNLMINKMAKETAEEVKSAIRHYLLMNSSIYACVKLKKALLPMLVLKDDDESRTAKPKSNADQWRDTKMRIVELDDRISVLNETTRTLSEICYDCIGDELAQKLFVKAREIGGELDKLIQERREHTVALAYLEKFVLADMKRDAQ